MREIFRQAVGIDVSQDELVVILGRLYSDFQVEFTTDRSFANNPSGFKALLSYAGKFANGLPIQYAMEATGVYHEQLAYFLSDHQVAVSVILPNKISNYFRTLEVKTITDKTAAQAIALFALERRLEPWSKPQRIFRTLKQLIRERGQLIDERTMQKNQLHSEKAEKYPSMESIRRIEARTALINSQIKEIQQEIDQAIKEDDSLLKKIQPLLSIPGVGKLTAVTIIAETNGFELIRNKRQLVSYAGLDVIEKTSGTSVRGKKKISKKGNRHIRKAMYMPALAAIRQETRFKHIYARLIAKHGIRMKAAVAIQRKMLELIFILWKSQQHYNPDFKNQMAESN